MAFSDIFQLSNVEKVSQGFKQYVVTPALDFGIAGFTFDVEGEVIQEATNDITDHYVEDNSVIQDHAASRPLKVTLRGSVGELVARESNVGNILQDLGERLVTLDSYLPQLAAQATQTLNVLDDLNNFDLQEDLSGLSNLYSTIKNLDPTASKQQRAYLFFKSLKERRIPMSLQTPFEFLQNMMIESLIARQDATTNDIAEFEITLKQIRTASVTFEKFDPENFAGRGGFQSAPTEDKGVAQGENVSIAFQKLTDNNILSEGVETYRWNIAGDQ